MLLLGSANVGRLVAGYPFSVSHTGCRLIRLCPKNENERASDYGDCNLRPAPSAMDEWDNMLTSPLSCQYSLNIDVRLSNQFGDLINLAQEMTAYSHATSTRLDLKLEMFRNVMLLPLWTNATHCVTKLPTIQQAASAEDKSPTSAQRNNSCTTKPTKVSSGNRFYTDVIRRWGGYLCVVKDPPDVSEASFGGKSGQVETSTEPSAEDESEAALEERLVHKNTLHQKDRGKTSSEEEETFARIKWREVVVTNTHSRTFSFPCVRMEMVSQEDERVFAGESVDKLRRRIEEQQNMFEWKSTRVTDSMCRVSWYQFPVSARLPCWLHFSGGRRDSLCSARFRRLDKDDFVNYVHSYTVFGDEYRVCSVLYTVLGVEHHVYTIFTRSRSRTESL
jgi:hypothetical protein